MLLDNQFAIKETNDTRVKLNDTDDRDKAQPTERHCFKGTQVKQIIDTDESDINLSSQQQPNKHKSKKTENNDYFEEIKILKKSFRQEKIIL
jgi:hypothetical protein